MRLKSAKSTTKLTLKKKKKLVLGNVILHEIRMNNIFTLHVCQILFVYFVHNYMIFSTLILILLTYFHVYIFRRKISQMKYNVFTEKKNDVKLMRICFFSRLSDKNSTLRRRKYINIRCFIFFLFIHAMNCWIIYEIVAPSPILKHTRGRAVLQCQIHRQMFINMLNDNMMFGKFSGYCRCARLRPKTYISIICVLVFVLL